MKRFFCAISELEFTEAYEALPPALKLIWPKPYCKEGSRNATRASQLAANSA
jgi:hypothetical protein